MRWNILRKASQYCGCLSMLLEARRGGMGAPRPLPPLCPSNPQRVFKPPGSPILRLLENPPFGELGGTASMCPLRHWLFVLLRIGWTRYGLGGIHHLIIRFNVARHRLTTLLQEPCPSPQPSQQAISARYYALHRSGTVVHRLFEGPAACLSY